MDELQEIWNSHQVADEQRLDEAQLNSLLIAKSENVLAKINRILRLDVLIMLMVSSFFIAMTFVLDLANRNSVITIISVMMAYLAIQYYGKRQLSSKHDFNKDNILDILKNKLKSLKLSKRLNIIGIPILFLGFYLYLQSILSGAIDNITFIQVGIGILISLVSFFFTNWLFERLFGNQIRVIEEIMKELDH
jgi:uncharacterized membrane protein YccF (DUF307 family)